MVERDQPSWPQAILSAIFLVVAAGAFILDLVIFLPAGLSFSDPTLRSMFLDGLALVALFTVFAILGVRGMFGKPFLPLFRLRSRVWQGVLFAVATLLLIDGVLEGIHMLPWMRPLSGDNFAPFVRGPVFIVLASTIFGSLPLAPLWHRRKTGGLKKG